MSLQERIDEYVRACFTGIWIRSHEHADALRELATLCSNQDWTLATWNVASGLKLSGGDPVEGGEDPLAAVKAAAAFANHTDDESERTTLIVLENFHRFLQSAEIVQAVAEQVISGKQSRTILVVLAPTVQLPLELEKLFVVVDHELPGREQLAGIASGIATEAGELPEGEDLRRLLDAACGLTRYEAENAFSLSLVRDGRLLPETLWQQKSQMITKTGSLSLYRGDSDFQSLGGLESLKAFTRRALLRSSQLPTQHVRPRGVLLLSPPGCGKSQFCKALGKETGRPVLQLDVGSLMGSLVGQSEERTRQALEVADAMAPCVLMIDELDKAFAGVAGSGSNDSGVSARMFGAVLSWLNDHESDVFVVCTCNDISRLPPEFSRSERFDGVFFVDLPGADQKEAIWSLYLNQFELDPQQKRPADDQWTGAEIKACCRLSRLLDVPLVQAAENVVPIAVTAAESVERLRSWASGRCLDADKTGIYRHQAKRNSGRRRITRGEPSEN